MLSVSAANRIVLTSRRKDCCEVFALTDEGRAFQARADATMQEGAITDC